jgi:hypothetical protein
MIYLRCQFYETTMDVLGFVMDVLERHDFVRAAIALDSFYQQAWDALCDAKPELERKLSRRFPATFLEAEGDEYRCGLCRY